jgi:acyl-CoA dehydrogenase
MTIITNLGGKASALRTEIESTTAVARDFIDMDSRASIAATIAARHATTVDRESRFPREAFAAIREQNLLGILVPSELGGEGCDVADVLDVCYRLGRACSSTGMIYAMHQVKVACLVRHGHASLWQQGMLRRLVRKQLLMASSTTEGQAGGNIRSSEAPIVYHADSRVTLERQATCISYGEAADGIVTTARRSADAPASDQVLAVFLKEDYTLEAIVPWDTLGMRGTCSSGYVLRAAGCQEQILPVSYDKIHTQTMVPSAHLMWSSVWAGIAASAVDCAQSFIRTAARKSSGALPSGAPHFVKAKSALAALRSLITSSLRQYTAIANDEAGLTSFEFQNQIALLKVEASELAVSIVLEATRACGLAGYRNDSPFALGRHLRDILSSPFMINNDRILSNATAASLMSAVPASLRDQ